MDFFVYVKNNKLVILIISIILNIIFLISTSILVLKIANTTCDGNEEAILEDDIKKEEPDKDEEEEVFATPKEYYVEVKGAVNTPGVYKVADNNIINDVIKMAGGFNKDAYTDNINLSHHLEDELVIYVYTKADYKKKNNTTPSCNCPTYDISSCTDTNSSIITSNDEKKTESSSSITPSDENTSGSDKTKAPSGKININTASLSELMTLTGIGEAKAKDIIDYRTKNGLFQRIEDIKKVNGIKDAIFNKIKDNITV